MRVAEKRVALFVDKAPSIDQRINCLLQRGRGYRATVVSGKVTWRDGEATGALPGRLIRGPQAAR